MLCKPFLEGQGEQPDGIAKFTGYFRARAGNVPPSDSGVHAAFDRVQCSNRPSGHTSGTYFGVTSSTRGRQNGYVCAVCSARFPRLIFGVRRRWGSWSWTFSRTSARECAEYREVMDMPRRKKTPDVNHGGRFLAGCLATRWCTSDGGDEIHWTRGPGEWWPLWSGCDMTVDEIIELCKTFPARSYPSCTSSLRLQIRKKRRPLEGDRLFSQRSAGEIPF
jgi:hypothetical protein